MQALAVLVDSWRMLSSRRLFWVTLAINLLVVLAYASIGFTERGISIGFGIFSLESEEFRAGAALAKALYVSLFFSIIVALWLTWLATGIALISTSSIFPDFIAEGAVDMVLSRPIGRMKVFLLKYAGALLFVLIQVGVFCLGAFLAVGWRLDEWQWRIFLAVPIVLFFYSSLYCVNVLVGIITRSAIAALLATGFFWFVVWCVQSGEQILLNQRVRIETQIDWIDQTVEGMEQDLQRLAAEGKNSDNDNQYERIRGTIAQRRQQADGVRPALDAVTRWHERFRTVQWILPKNQETTGLIERWLRKEDEPSTVDIFASGAAERESRSAQAEGPPPEESLKGIARYYREQPWWRVLGSGALFQICVLALAAWIFARRDY